MRESFPGWVMNGDTTNAGLAFGNNLTYATNKEFANATHVKNQFYVWQVLTFEEAYLMDTIRKQTR